MKLSRYLTVTSYDGGLGPRVLRGVDDGEGVVCVCVHVRVCGDWTLKERGIRESIDGNLSIIGLIKFDFTGTHCSRRIENE